ncbi:MAG: sigma-70 family RNA polymerase sigma factor [Gammaproteobacteria bacterium]|nr:sigma-70 family RNA polymerase sigma factor [Gammaproteobacteria bacterium]
MAESEDNDIALVTRIAEGDKVAFRILFETYGERVFRYAYRMVNDRSLAEEVTNDVMLEVWKGAHRFEGRSKASTWVLGIARYLALNAIRGKQLVTVDLDVTPEAVDDQESNAIARDRATVKQKLRDALAKLSTDHREVVELTFFHGYSYQEVAEVMGCPENTVKTRMFHAKKQLRQALKRAGLDGVALEAVR